MINDMKKFLIKLIAPDYFTIKSENIELKARNVQLKHDIYNLVRRATKIEGVHTRIHYEMEYKTDDMMFYGEPTEGKLTGIFNVTN